MYSKKKTPSTHRYFVQFDSIYTWVVWFYLNLFAFNKKNFVENKITEKHVLLCGHICFVGNFTFMGILTLLQSFLFA